MARQQHEKDDAGGPHVNPLSVLVEAGHDDLGGRKGGCARLCPHLELAVLLLGSHVEVED